MEFFTEEDIKKVSAYGGTEVEDDKTEELNKIYAKLGYFCSLLQNKGFNYDIKRNPRSMGGNFKTYQHYLWAKIYPKGYYDSCKGKLAYIVAIDDSLHFHIGGLNSYESSDIGQSVMKKTWTFIDVEDSSYKEFVDKFISFASENETLFMETGASFGITECEEFINKLKMSEELAKLKSVIEHKKQIVLQGAPGTGKTYKTAELAVALCDGACDYPDREALMKRYQELCKEHRIMFTTFHQSMDYESFIEGIKPGTEDGAISYDVEDGIFKQICNRASVKSSTNTFDEAYQKLVDDVQNTANELLILYTKRGAKFAISLNRKGNLNLHTGSELKKQGVLTKENLLQASFRDDIFIGWEGYASAVIEYLTNKCRFVKDTNGEVQNYVLIIDEINRGNISKIFGELITLLEADKRIGEENEIELRLPYSGDLFGVPSNLYIIATMNTADRSVGYIDYAIRRRFSFITIKSDEAILETAIRDSNVKDKALALYEQVEELMSYLAIDFNQDDLMIGHSYFIAQSEEELQLKLDYEIKPLLREYANDGILVLSKEDEKAIDNLSI